MCGFWSQVCGEDDSNVGYLYSILFRWPPVYELFDPHLWIVWPPVCGRDVPLIGEQSKPSLGS